MISTTAVTVSCLTPWRRGISRDSVHSSADVRVFAELCISLVSLSADSIACAIAFATLNVSGVSSRVSYSVGDPRYSHR